MTNIIETLINSIGKRKVLKYKGKLYVPVDKSRYKKEAIAPKGHIDTEPILKLYYTDESEKFKNKLNTLNIDELLNLLYGVHQTKLFTDNIYDCSTPGFFDNLWSINIIKEEINKRKLTEHQKVEFNDIKDEIDGLIEKFEERCDCHLKVHLPDNELVDIAPGLLKALIKRAEYISDDRLVEKWKHKL